MPKKVKKSKKIRLHKHKSDSYLLIRYIGIVFAIALFVIAGKSLAAAANTPHVLGAQTGPLLADTGDAQDGQQQDHPDQQQPQQNQQDSQPKQDTQKPSQDTQQNPTQQGDTTQSSQPQDNTQVDCVGPDGKHFTTDFHNCQQLNQQWGNSRFTFTSLSSPSKSEQPEAQPSEAPQQPETKTIETPKSQLELQTENGQMQLNLETPSGHIELKRQDNGSVQLTLHQEGGQEIQVQSNQLDQLNQLLKEKDLEIGTGSANKLVIKSQNVEAETALPLTIDPSTKSLAVATSGGTTTIINPSQAVWNVLSSKTLSNILSVADTNTASAGAASNMIALTTLNNQPAFEIQGVTNKKLLGIFPIGFAKTVYIAADNGQVLQVNQSVLNQLLQILSF